MRLWRSTNTLPTISSWRENTDSSRVMKFTTRTKSTSQKLGLIWSWRTEQPCPSTGQSPRKPRQNEKYAASFQGQEEIISLHLWLGSPNLPEVMSSTCSRSYSITASKWCWWTLSALPTCSIRTRSTLTCQLTQSLTLVSPRSSNKPQMQTCLQSVCRLAQTAC